MIDTTLKKRTKMQIRRHLRLLTIGTRLAFLAIWNSSIEVLWGSAIVVPLTIYISVFLMDVIGPFLVFLGISAGIFFGLLAAAKTIINLYFVVNNRK